MKLFFSSTTKIFFLSFVLMLAALSLYAFLLQKVFVAGEKIETLEKEQAGQAAKERAFETLRRTFEESASERKMLATYFLHEKDAVSFIEEIEDTSAKTNTVVDLTNVSIKDDAPGTALELNMKVTGSFPDVFSFLSFFEQMPYAFSYERVFLKESGNDGEWEAEMIVKLLSFLKEER